jgi:hypothetical protein
VLHVHPINVLLAMIGDGQQDWIAGVIFTVLRVFFRARIQTSSKSDPGSPDHLYRHPTVIVSGSRLLCSLVTTIVRLSPGSRSK